MIWVFRAFSHACNTWKSGKLRRLRVFSAEAFVRVRMIYIEMFKPLLREKASENTPPSVVERSESVCLWWITSFLRAKMPLRKFPVINQLKMGKTHAGHFCPRKNKHRRSELWSVTWLCSRELKMNNCAFFIVDFSVWIIRRILYMKFIVSLYYKWIKFPLKVRKIKIDVINYVIF